LKTGLKPAAFLQIEEPAAAGLGLERVAVRMGLSYGLGMVGERLFRDAPALLLLVFMTNYLGIPAAWAGVAIFAPKLMLICVDPWVGFSSDTSTRPQGRRKPFLIVGAFASAAAFILMFNVPHIADTTLRTVYMTLLIGAAFAVYSIYSVPYLSFASDLASDPHQRTRLLAYRMAFLAVGLNLSASAGILIERLGGGITGYQSMSYVYGAVCLLTMLTPALLLRDRPIARRSSAAPGLRRRCWARCPSVSDSSRRRCRWPSTMSWLAATRRSRPWK